jgi:hypothetical protein
MILPINDFASSSPGKMTGGQNHSVFAFPDRPVM